MDPPRPEYLAAGERKALILPRPEYLTANSLINIFIELPCTLHVENYANVLEI